MNVSRADIPAAHRPYVLPHRETNEQIPEWQPTDQVREQSGHRYSEERFRRHSLNITGGHRGLEAILAQFAVNARIRTWLTAVENKPRHGKGSYRRRQHLRDPLL